MEEKNLSSSQYALKHSIKIYEDYISKDETKKATPLMYSFKRKLSIFEIEQKRLAKERGEIYKVEEEYNPEVEVGLKYDDYVYTINCFPYNYSGLPKKTMIEMRMEKVALNLGFLNKGKTIESLYKYIDIIFKNKYEIYGHKFSDTKYKKIIKKGKNKELEEMEFDKRKYVWHKKYMNLSKSIKSKIMINERFGEEILKNTKNLCVAMNKLYMRDDFIHNKLVADISGMNIKTVEKYITTHKDKIDEHNEIKHNTTNYNTYINNVTLKEIKDSVARLKRKKKKLSISNISKETESNIHRNTISRLNKKHNLF